MSISLLITLILIVVFAGSVSLGYFIGRTSARAGVAFAAGGTLVGVVLIVNYFVEVPVVAVAVSFAVVAVSMAFALLDVLRKDSVPHPA